MAIIELNEFASVIKMSSAETNMEITRDRMPSQSVMNYFNYFTEIEEEFVKRRGSHMLVSPLDWSLMESWKQRGVPLHIVLRGINSSFDSYDKRSGRIRKVNSLLYCQQEVELMFVQYGESRVGSSGEPVVEGQPETENGAGGKDSPFTIGSVIDYLNEQREALELISRKHAAEAALTETLNRIFLRLDQILDDLRTGKNLPAENLETDLTMIEEVLLDGLRESAGEARLAELKKEAAGQLRSYRQTMESAVYDQTLNNLIARKLREQYQVPRLSLFYL